MIKAVPESAAFLFVKYIRAKKTYFVTNTFLLYILMIY